MVFGRLAKKLLGRRDGAEAPPPPPPPPLAAAAPAAGAAAPGATARPSSDNTRARYAGVNCYYLLTRAADPGCRPMVLATLDAIAATPGLSVVRCWAFCDGEAQWNALQPRPGELDERVLQGLDWLLAESGKRGLRLQLTLTNFWKDFGGMPQYVAWSRGAPLPERGDAFFDDAHAQQMFRAFVEKIVARVSTVTGRAYRDDPAIHAWDLVNEPRCEGDDDASGAADKVARWLHETAALVKSLDPNHRVTAGLEGFFGPSTPDLAARANPYSSAASHGVDFVRAFASPHLDFASIHLYPNQWLTGGGDAERLEWAAAWVEAHAQACVQLLGGKPLCVQEFGWKPSGPRRPDLFRAVLGACSSSSGGGSSSAGGGAGVVEGALAWMYADPSYPDYDGYTLYPAAAGGKPTAEAEAQSVGGKVWPDTESLRLLAEYGGGGATRPS